MRMRFASSPKMTPALLAAAAVVLVAGGIGTARAQVGPPVAAHGESRASGLPAYKPEQTVSGTIRNFGFGLGGVLKLWEDDFRKIHPGVTFVDNLPTRDRKSTRLNSS